MDTRRLEVQTEASGAVPKTAIELAVRKIRSLLRFAPEPVLFARVRLAMAADPAARNPAVVQANLDLNGRVIRAEVNAPDMREAVERMHDRLRIRLQRAARNWAAIRGRKPVSLPHEWRHQSVRSPHADYFPRPPGERTVIRHESYTPTRETLDEAATELELLDYDFHLFTDRATGQDTVIYRTAGGLRLARARPRRGRLGARGSSVTLSERPAPRLTVAEARSRLEALGQRFLFFVDSGTGRGNLIYHRYDGHYGLVTPAA